MTRDEQVDLLVHGEIEVLGRITGSSNQALLVQLESNSVSALACYKAERGERPLWDFPDGLWRREIAAYELDVALGTDLVPTTVARDDAPFGRGSLQWWVDDNEVDHYFTLRERSELHHWFRTLGAFDVVANNADRKSGHVIFDGERCWAIDNGLCFHEEDKLRTVIWEFADEPIDATVLESLDRFSHGAVGALGEWLSPIELALTQDRARILAEHAVLPAPDERREWPPYPWPLI
jgi:uncharacterized repeat protein (TIGR03843 family)